MCAVLTKFFEICKQTSAAPEMEVISGLSNEK